MTYAATVNVMPKQGISDPEGQTIERALPALGYTGVSHVRVGKMIELQVEAADEDEARSRVVDMCERLLANTIIEGYEIEIVR